MAILVVLTVRTKGLDKRCKMRMGMRGVSVTKKEGKEKEGRTRVEVGRNEGERERSEKGGEEGSHA